MKNLIIILLFLWPVSIFCQAGVIATCTDIRLASPPNSTNAIVPLTGSYDKGKCGFIMGVPDVTRKYALEKEIILPTNFRAFETTTFLKASHVFSNLPHGTYRILTATPTLEMNPSCPITGGRVSVYNLALQFLGFKSNYNNPTVTTSASATVGQTQQSDINWSFVHNNGFSLGSGDAYDYGQTVFMRPTLTTNYTDFWIAIFENGGANRSVGAGWTHGQFIFDINLSDIWKNGTANWKFEAGNTYTVQYAITNSSCGGLWTNLDKSFYVCPAGSNCRLNTEKVQKIVSVIPNPAQNTFQFNNFEIELYKNKDYDLTVHDLSGKQLKSFKNFNNPNFDISDLPNGLYIVNFSESNNRLITRKLVVSR
jgi:Secretion system C-terminal sorting domain